MTLSPGLTLRGRYRPAQQIAVGGMGEIWRAEDTLLGRSVAIKLVRPEYVDDSTFRDRFRNEARHAAVLTHPNVTQVFDFDEGDGGETPYLVMEFVDGPALSTLLEQKGRLSDEETWSIVGQTAGALAAAHAIGVVHRDVKPGNILVCPDGWVKVTDFGISRAVDQAGTTQTGFTMGTANYLAPEICRGEPSSPATDLYALGVVAYECLTGTTPFTGDLATVLQAQLHEEPPPLPDTVAPALRDLVMALLAKDPADRPTDANEIAAQAQRLSGRPSITGAPALARLDPYPVESTAPRANTEMITDDDLQATQATRLPMTSQRRLAMLALASLAALAVLAGVVLLVVRATAGDGSSATPKHSASAAPTHKPVRVTSTTVYSPDGSGADHPEELALATDGSASSAWYTEHYATADFGQLKSGTGLVVRVPASADVRTVTVRFTQPGLTAKLYSGDSASSLLQQAPQAKTASAPQVWRVQLDQPTHAAYWLVWITKLVPDDGAYRAGIADLRVTS